MIRKLSGTQEQAGNNIDVLLDYDDVVDEEGLSEFQRQTEDNPDIFQNYDDVDGRRAVESQFTDMDDLPALPKNLSSLSSLCPGEAKVGMVITWKQWLLSKGTNWQPQVGSLTAVVVNVEGRWGNPTATTCST